MDIGSAKIMPDEMEGVPHYLVDILEPSEEFHIAKFQEMAKKAMDEIYERGHVPSLVGGTGFYIQSITRDIDFTENDGDMTYRHELEEYARIHGGEELHVRLKTIDPKAAEEIHANNIKRVIRALEYYHQTGQRISEHNEEQKLKESPYKLTYFVLNDIRCLLYERIEKRIDQMIDTGLIDEVKRLKAMGYHRNMVSMQGLGYKEILAYLDGEYTLDEAIYILKRDTRHFAKRQLTWFKREENVIWVNKNEFHYDNKKILEYMLGKYYE